MLPSGQQSVLANRVGWAKTHLKKAGLLDNPKRGYVTISERGKQVLAQKPERIAIGFLNQFPEFKEFRTKTTTEQDEEPTTQGTTTQTPEEQLEASYRALRQALAEDLLEKVKASTPAFFERLVVELLVAMGYGGSLEDAGQAVGRPHDGGIDGIIKEDKLGLDAICIQAKRWEDTVVGRPVVQSFAGSMEGHRARKGVLITTSSFSKDAQEYVARIERKIVLIDGQTLAQLMIDHDIGVSTARTYTLKRIDSDYFSEEEA
jgi:restriction system protein